MVAGSSNSIGDSGGTLHACGGQPQSGTMGFPRHWEFVPLHACSRCQLPKHIWQVERKQVWEGAVKRSLGEDCFGGAIVWGPQLVTLVGKYLLVSTLWNNAVMDTSFVYTFSGILYFSSYNFWPVHLGQQGQFCAGSYREPAG